MLYGSSMRRDAQKQKVYDWQWNIYDAVIDTHPEIFIELPLEACQSFTNKLCAAYGVDAPKVVAHRFKDGNARCYSQQRKIVLPAGWAWTAKTVGHEVAHWLNHKLFPKHEQGHGPEFVTIYSNIMTKFLGLDVELVQRFTDQARIKSLAVCPVPGVFHANR